MAAITQARLAKATTMIVENRVGFNAGSGEFTVASTSGVDYRVVLYLGVDDPAWRCTCEWGKAHSYETGNECSHALAARYYADDNDLTADDLGVTNSNDDEDGDPFAGL